MNHLLALGGWLWGDLPLGRRQRRKINGIRMRVIYIYYLIGCSHCSLTLFKSFYGDPYGFGGGYGPPSYYPAYPAQYYSSGNTVHHHRRKPPKEKDNAQVWCDICDVGCIGQQSYIGISLFLLPCNIPLNSAMAYHKHLVYIHIWTEHCGGRKHQLLERKKAQQLSSAASPQEGQRIPINESDQLASSTSTISTTSTTSTTSNVRFNPYETGNTQGSKGTQGK